MLEQPKQSPVSPRARHAGAFAPVAVALAVFLAFAGSLRGEFLNWDDPTNFLNNPHYRGLGWARIRWMFTSSLQLGHYMPLTWLSLGFDYSLWGMNPIGYHLTNLLLHSANAAVFYCVSRRLLEAAARADAAPFATRLDLAAAFSALIFALHPLRVESVAWITERRDVLSGFFYLLAILFYLKSAACGDKPPGARRLGVSVFLFGLALASKINGITLPLALIVIDVYPLGRLPGNPMHWFSTGNRRVLLEKIPFLLLTIPAGWLGIVGQQKIGGLARADQWGAAQRAGVALYGAAFYVWKTIAPWRLSPYYSLPSKPNLLAEPFLLGASFVVATTLFAFAARRRWPAVLAAWAFYLVALLPVSGLAQIGAQLAADRYTYIPCWGFAVLAAGAADRLLNGDGRRRWKLAAVAGVLLAALSVFTWRQVAVWRDSETLWRHALAVDPDDAVAHNNLGMDLDARGRKDAAFAEFAAAVRSRPDNRRALLNLGSALWERGKVEEAVALFRAALALPGDDAGSESAQVSARALVDLGSYAWTHGRAAEAEANYREALRLDSNSSPALVGLGNALAARGLSGEAAASFRAALRVDPESAAARSNLKILMSFTTTNNRP